MRWRLKREGEKGPVFEEGTRERRVGEVVELKDIKGGDGNGATVAVSRRVRETEKGRAGSRGRRVSLVKEQGTVNREAAKEGGVGGGSMRALFTIKLLLAMGDTSSSPDSSRAKEISRAGDWGQEIRGKGDTPIVR